MIEITILGTACMQPTKERNHPALFLSYQNENLLFDCGENTQRQLRIANLKPAKITRIFISHWHGDHVLGLPGLINTMGTDQLSKKLWIYGPPGTKKHLNYAFKAFLGRFLVEHEIIELSPPQTLNFPEFSIEARKLEHNAFCLGYSFIEKDRRKIRPLYIKKIPGLLLGRLQKNQVVTYQNKKITPGQATYLVPGKKISIIMDTRPCNNFLKLAQNADLLFSEATFLEKDKDKAEEYYHMTAQEAALLANQAQVKKLILLHFSPRYKDIQEIREEVKKVFRESVCAEDFMKFRV